MSAPTKNSAQDADWELVTELVNAHRGELQEMGSHVRLRKWAEENGLATQARFGKFKHRLTKIGVDYNQLRSEATRRDQVELEQAAALGETPHITLCAAGDAQASTFAVCDSAGGALWYDTFHENDRHFQGDDASAATSAAEKAVWLAGKARRAGAADAATLHLTVSHHDLDDGVLAAAAVRARVVLTVEVADINPALAWCRENGYQSFKDVEDRLADLLDYDTTEGAE
jgi:hypothetical protein